MDTCFQMAPSEKHLTCHEGTKEGESNSLSIARRKKDIVAPVLTVQRQPEKEIICWNMLTQF